MPKDTRNFDIVDLGTKVNVCSSFTFGFQFAVIDETDAPQNICTIFLRFGTTNQTEKQGAVDKASYFASTSKDV